MKQLIAGVAIILCMMVGAAGAVEFSGSAYGEWDNVISKSWDIYEVNNNDAGGLADFNWGQPYGTPFNNQFTFDGVGSDGDDGWHANTEEAFLIGDFFYQNGDTLYASGIKGVDLNLSLSIVDPFAQFDSYDFGFKITNTFNTTGDPVLDGDIVTLQNFISETMFTYNEIEYTLELLGFSTDGGVSFSYDFSSPESSNAKAGIYAKITATNQSAPIPEPSTIILTGIGLLVLAGRQWRCRLKFRPAAQS